MEPAEDASLEPAIQWLAQSILASPLIHEQATWVREAGLAEEIEGLKSEVKGVRLVVSAVKGRALGNEPLAESLVDLREVLYDADDAVDELDYWRLLQLDQEDDLDQTDGPLGASQDDRSIENADVPSTTVTLPEPHAPDGRRTQLVETSRGNAATRSSSVGKLQSKLWKEFEILEFNQKGAPVRAKCIHCETKLACPTKQGTGVLQNHLKSKACLKKKREGSDPLSTADATTNPGPVPICNLSSKKRRRDDESTSLVTVNTSRLNKDDFSKKIRHITLKLRHIREGLIHDLSILGSDSAASSSHSQRATSDQRRRTSGILQATVYGRDSEKDIIIKFMEQHKFSKGATVLPILGIAGVGKTALAQLVYNHPAVKNQFDHLVWIWVSNNFDATELTKEMLASVSQETHVGLCNFTKLQEILESRIKSKRVLLILDDVWDGIHDYQWNQLLAPFNSDVDNTRHIMIIVTTRKPCVAKRRGTVRPIQLEALEKGDFWLYFGACAFGYVNLEKQQSLSDLGQQIAQKLKGNPLAAETAGALLCKHHTVGHWSSILKNEDWKSLTLSGGIMSALKLCYDQLPYHLQKCFSYCSLFPCNYRFLAEELVRIWISQGFVMCNNSSKKLEEIGRDYLADLVNLGFFEQFKNKSSLGCNYVMYDLMHDFARVVSRTECTTIDGLQCSRMFPTVRHLSITSNSIYQMEHRTGNIACREKFEKILRSTVTSVGKLRSLVLIGQYDSSFFLFFKTALQKAHSLRLLRFSATSVDLPPFPYNLVNPAHLRYLELENGHVEQGTLPQLLSKSFHLQVLDVNQCTGAWLASLQTVHLDNSGEPPRLPSLERLRCLTRLKLSNMQNITEVSVPSLEELVLLDMPKLKTCSCNSVGDLKSGLRVLEIKSCPVLEVFDLFQKVNYAADHNFCLPNLEKLIICNCPNLHVVIPLPPSATISNFKGPSSQTLRIKANSVLGDSPCEIILDSKFLSLHNMSYLEYLKIKDCWNIVSILLSNFHHNLLLRSLEIENCKELISPDGDLIPSNDSRLLFLESLSIKSCGITGKWLFLMLRKSSVLKELYLNDCPQMTRLQIEEDDYRSNLLLTLDEFLTLSRDSRDKFQDMSSYSCLRKVSILDCPNLIFDGSRKGFVVFTSLEKLKIRGCPKLLSSVVHNDDQVDGILLLPESLEELVIDEYSHETLRPCFVDDFTLLRKFEVTTSTHLISLQLDACKAMQHLRICQCSSLATLEGLLSLVNLTELIVVNSPVLASLATSGEGCQGISGLSNGVLPPSLEVLEIEDCSSELSAYCRSLATDRLRVKINGRYVY